MTNDGWQSQLYDNRIFEGKELVMAKVKTFGSQLKIFHVKEELETLDNTVNEFIFLENNLNGGISKNERYIYL